MRRATIIVTVSYVLAGMVAVAAVVAGHLALGRSAAAVSFAVLLAAIGLGPRSAGRTLALCAVATTALMIASFVSRLGDNIGEGAVATATVLWGAAMLRSGGWARLRERKLLIIGLSVPAYALGALALIGLGTSLPADLNQPRMCVDSCFGPAIGVFLSVLLLAEVGLLVMMALAFTRSVVTGIGALIVIAAQNVLFFQGPATVTIGYALPLAAWLIGLATITWPWTAHPPVKPAGPAALAAPGGLGTG
jgi:hypothetical protein